MGGERRETIYGDVAADFIEDRLRNLCDPAIGIQTGPFGSQLHQEDYVPIGTPIVTVEHLGENRILHEGVPRVSDADRDRLSRYLLREGDIVFSRVGSVDRRALVREAENGWMFSGRCLRVRPDLEKIDPGYLSYFFGLPAFQAHIRAIAVGATMPSLNTSLLSDVVILYPPDIAEQRAIAHILGTLDHKIELNRRMNETLEAMAEALFKSWFVDFDPVRAKANGRDPGLPKRVADLFPDSFVDSALGRIPKGWHTGRVDDILSELVSGARPKGGAVDEGVPSIGAENVIGLGRYDFSKEKFVPEDFFEQLRLRGASVRGGDVLLYKDGAQIGRKTLFDCGFPHAKCGVNEHVFILRTNKPAAQRFLYFWLDQAWMTHEIISLNSNSAQPGINQPGVRGLPILIPRDEIVDAFDQHALHLTRRLFANSNESQTLVALRDTLVPKVITGELRVKDASSLSQPTLGQVAGA